MKDFSPHAILRDPSISDEEVERLIKQYSKDGAPVILILDPDISPTPRDERSSPAPWPSKPKTQEKEHE